MSSPRDPATPRALSDALFCSRGLSILLVVLVHVMGVESSQGLRKLFVPERADLRFAAGLLHSFNMAVMLMNSGAAVFLFAEPNPSFLEFTRRKLRKLVVPMFVWAPVALGLQELLRGGPRTLDGWLVWMGRLPTAWFPPYGIFWFVHALVGCTLLAWIYRRLVPAPGPWAGPGYLGLSLLAHAIAESWGAATVGVGASYLRLILFSNCFFASGLALAPGLGPVMRGLSRLPRALQAAVPVGCLGLMVALQAWSSTEGPWAPRQLNGPLGFCMQFSLAVVLLDRARRAWLLRGLVYLGSISMPIYLFHIYFVSGPRQALERAWPGAPLPLHLVLGALVGVLGPWGVYRLLRPNRAFRWSIGLS
ncbi:hypothetical protein CYFUS_002533 [Cystobacter fuscus]|uniref:Acyltransferase 3 domain-containing protein n=1 Tax=Cystobacter fuscus TaxID=43 RepID=A0A250J0V3_9BACT|nr:acyltransferase [Cystobacter fuscus]ATB37112.1 hypothetical protein CYFUS_002533 [Cystobacter fuscus]